MKVTIIKKMIKEGTSPRTGNEYSIKSLFVKFEDEAVYSRIVKHLEAKGCNTETIERFCKPKDYNGQTNYAFGLNCSRFTFDRVEKFGELDAKIDFVVNDQGYINPKIAVVERKEQVLSYTPPSFTPEPEVEGWATDAPDPIVDEKSELEGEAVNENKPTIQVINDKSDELPF